MRHVGKKVLKMMSGAALAAVLLQYPTAYAQEQVTVPEKYRNDQALITNYSEHLIITNEHGVLTAHSKVTQERLLISDQAPGLYSKEYIFHSFFHRLDEYDAEARMPAKNGYKTVKSYDARTKTAEQNNIFYDDAKQTEITFTGLTRNSLLKTTYTLSHADLNMLPTYYFQENLPVLHSSFTVTAPKYVNLKFVFKGENTGWIKQAKEETKNTVTYSFTAEDVPAMKDYDDIPSITYYVPHIITYITSYQLPHDDKPTEMMQDPAHLYAYLYHFIQHVNTTDDEAIKAKVADVVKADKTEREKAAHIYQWVQANMHYVAFEDSLGSFIPRQAADIFKRKFGDCKDMASILTAMYRSAGIDAHFTWIGTRDKPYTYAETPLPLVDNHMICSIKVNGEWLFIDGTDPLIPFGANPKSIQGKEAMIAIDEKHFEIIRIPETDLAQNTITDSTTMHIDGKKLAGKLSITYKGYPAWDLGNYLMYYKNQERDKFILGFTSRGSNKFIQSSYDYTPLANEYKDNRISADFMIDDYVQDIEKESIVNMNIQRYFDGIWIDGKDRTSPYQFSYKKKVKEVVTLNIPDGYKTSYIPPDAARSLDGAWSYKISYNTTPKLITLIKEYELNTLSIKPSMFEENNKMVEELRKQYKESVVLTKQ